MTSTIERALHHLSQGGMIVVTDDEGRENEGDLVMAARFATPPAINFMITQGRGLLCVPMEKTRAKNLGLPPMCETNNDPHRTAFTVSVDACTTSTGISAADRTKTIQALAHPEASKNDFRRPGHIFPLVAKSGGITERRGHTEAAVDLVRYISSAGQPAVAVICEILSRDGSMKRGAALSRFCTLHRLPKISIQQLVDYTRRNPKTVPGVIRRAETKLPTKQGVFRTVAYDEPRSGKEHLALVYGNLQKAKTPLCRIHSECLTGDVLGSKRCDCGEQLTQAMERISAAGAGIIIYLRQEGRGIGLTNKIKAYALQDTGIDTVDANLLLGFQADERNYRVAAEILIDLGIRTVSLLTNNPQKVSGLTESGITVHERVPLIIEPRPENQRYLETKKTRMNHQLTIKEGKHERI